MSAPIQDPHVAAADLIRRASFESAHIWRVAERMWAEGESSNAIAKRLDCPEHRVYRVLAAQREQRALQRRSA